MQEKFPWHFNLRRGFVSFLILSAWTLIVKLIEAGANIRFGAIPTVIIYWLCLFIMRKVSSSMKEKYVLKHPNKVTLVQNGDQ